MSVRSVPVAGCTCALDMETLAGYALLVTWEDFVGAMRDLVAVNEQVHCVMRHDDSLTLLDYTGKLLLEDSRAEQGEIVFSIEGKGGGFEITREHLGETEWLPEPGSARTLKMVMKQGYPVFTLCAEGTPVETALASSPRS
jgi:hypothetical protein